MCSVCGCGHAHDRAHVDGRGKLARVFSFHCMGPLGHQALQQVPLPTDTGNIYLIGSGNYSKNKTLGICEKVLKICSSMFKMVLPLKEKPS